jgi:hypothetical protein
LRLILTLLRLLLPAVGVLGVALGLVDAPRRGDPPLGSIVSRAETVVRESGVEPAARVARYEPAVEIAWPPGADATARLRGIEPTGYRGSRSEAEAVAAAFPPGTRVRVRVADGLPWADRTDWFALLFTLGTVLLGGLLTIVGLALNRAMKD